MTLKQQLNGKKNDEKLEEKRNNLPFFAEPCCFPVQRLEDCWHEILFVLEPPKAGLCEEQGK